MAQPVCRNAYIPALDGVYWYSILLRFYTPNYPTNVIAIPFLPALPVLPIR